MGTTPLNILISPANKGDFSSENDGFALRNGQLDRKDADRPFELGYHSFSLTHFIRFSVADVWESKSLKICVRLFKDKYKFIKVLGHISFLAVTTLSPLGLGLGKPLLDHFFAWMNALLKMSMKGSQH